jgi:hypothetical protein
MIYGPKIPLQSIRTYWDAGNPNSYVSGSSTWTDLIQGSTMTLSGSSASSEFPSILFGSGGGAVEDVGIDRRSGEYTIIVYSRMQPDGLDKNGRILQAKSNNWLLGHHNDYWGAYFANNWVYAPAHLKDNDVWRMYVGLGNHLQDVWSLWSNKTVLINKSTAGVQGPLGLAVGNTGAFAQGSDCEVGLILDYSRWLNYIEIVSIYESFRGRYNI